MLQLGTVHTYSRRHFWPYGVCTFNTNTEKAAKVFT